MSPAPERRRTTRTVRAASSRSHASGPPIERTAIALVLIVFGAIALIAELLGQVTGPSSDGALIIVLLFALLPVVGVVMLVVGDGQPAAQQHRRPRGTEQHGGHAHATHDTTDETPSER